jgi:hypothetical protein
MAECNYEGDVNTCYIAAERLSSTRTPYTDTAAAKRGKDTLFYNIREYQDLGDSILRRPVRTTYIHDTNDNFVGRRVAVR